MSPKLSTPVIVFREPVLLDHGSHGSVQKKDPFLDLIFKELAGHITVGPIGRVGHGVIFTINSNAGQAGNEVRNLKRIRDSTAHWAKNKKN
jgi:hypothetical protein